MAEADRYGPIRPRRQTATTGAVSARCRGIDSSERRPREGDGMAWDFAAVMSHGRDRRGVKGLCGCEIDAEYGLQVIDCAI